MFNEKKEELKSHIYQILKNFNQSLSSKQIYRYLVRKKFLNPKYCTWSTIFEIIREEIKKKQEKSLFFEEKLGIFGIREWKIERMKKLIEYPRTLIIFGNKCTILRKKTCFFIPEFSRYLKSLDVDERREVLISDEYKWRRRKNLLNLDNLNKKKRYFNLIKNFNQEDQEIEINLILDLDNNLVFYHKEILTIEKVIRLLYNQYKVETLDKDIFKNKVNEYILLTKR